ncbi:DHA2 family efflux MFS transporter permease subunit [Micromonospora sp. WMMD980]|uniref:DHA2 family efflux MFS transporter permease subunit n=1 Tax=Micromonospora sp. WMMD980 TaxID=3016088 RepID=UPI002415BBC3|nr:DHA2 family efflux MFS transporter permease subunit [Micromonospora sp. WMMD980]MDG4800230.1 DHA2 family efflux MFS transporter permease subunit [Micromonospora sp. WMMD980]
MSTTAPPVQPSRWAALIVLCAGFLMIILDQTIVNVALPSIQEDLKFEAADLTWVVNAYLIAFGGLLLLAGRLGDLIGRKRVFLSGLVVFVLASLWCGLATDQTMLIVARFVQGAGGAVTSAVILGMIFNLFPDPRELGKAIGIYSFVGAGGASGGLLLGGVLTQALSWHWIFFVNIPVGALIGIFGIRLLQNDSGLGLRRGADAVGAVLVTASLMIGSYAILKATEYGLGSAHTLGFGALAVLLLIAFIVRQTTARTPLLPLRVFRSRSLTGGNLVLGLMLAGMFSHLFLGSLYLQLVLGYSPFEIGLSFLPVSVSIGLLSVGASAPLNARFTPRWVAVVSLVFIAAGLALLGRAPVGGDYVADVLPALLCLGIGGGLAFPALVTIAMSGANPEDSGLASGVNNTVQQVGGALGLAVLATIAASRTADLLGEGKDQVTALDGGYDIGFATAAGIVLVAAVLGAVLLRPQPQAAPTLEPATVDDGVKPSV